MEVEMVLDFYCALRIWRCHTSLNVEMVLDKKQKHYKWISISLLIY